jgi:hypothetical protein
MEEELKNARAEAFNYLGVAAKVIEWEDCERERDTLAAENARLREEITNSINDSEYAASMSDRNIVLEAENVRLREALKSASVADHPAITNMEDAAEIGYNVVIIKLSTNYGSIHNVPPDKIASMKDLLDKFDYSNLPDFVTVEEHNAPTPMQETFDRVTT